MFGLKHPRGTTAQHATMIGDVGEMTIDTTKKTVVVHDGATAGGNPLATEAALGEITSQLAENTKLYRDKRLRATRNAQTVRTVVAIIDDDGNNGVLTKLKPLFTARGIPLGVASIGNSVLLSDPAKRADLLDLQNTHGWELLSHTMAHMNIRDSTDAEVESDCKAFLDMADGYGFDVENIAYPWGATEGKTHIISKYFSAGFLADGFSNSAYDFRNYKLGRYGLGSNMSSGMTTYANFTAMIDAAKASNDKFIVFMTHCDYTGNDMQLIEDVIDYVIAQDIEILSPREALRIYGHLVQSGRADGSEKYFALRPNGMIFTNRYALPIRGTSAILETDPPVNVGSSVNVKTYQVVGWSVGDGIVTEYLSEGSATVQELRTLATLPKIFRRNYVSGAWGAWHRDVLSFGSKTKSVTSTTIPANAAVDVLFTSEPSSLTVYAYIAQPEGTPEAGLTWSIWSHGNGEFKLRLANCTASPITTATRNWRIIRLETDIMG